MNVRLISILFLSSFVFMSCSSMGLMVDSEPQKASVYLKQGKKLRKIGETPLKLDADSLGDSKSYNLLIQKEGFQSESVLVETRTLSAKAEIFASLKVSNDSIGGGRGVASVDSEIGQRTLATIQSQLLNNRFQQAEVLARDFLNKSPNSAVGWSLLGNSYLLQNRNAEALGAYQRALEYDPGNANTQKMVNFLNENPTRRDR